MKWSVEDVCHTNIDCETKKYWTETLLSSIKMNRGFVLTQLWHTYTHTIELKSLAISTKKWGTPNECSRRCIPNFSLLSIQCLVYECEHPNFLAKSFKALSTYRCALSNSLDFYSLRTILSFLIILMQRMFVLFPWSDRCQIERWKPAKKANAASTIPNFCLLKAF